MNHLEVLEQALNQAAIKGAFNLNDASAVNSHLQAHKKQIEEMQKEIVELKKTEQEKK